MSWLSVALHRVAASHINLATIVQTLVDVAPIDPIEKEAIRAVAGEAIQIAESVNNAVKEIKGLKHDSGAPLFPVVGSPAGPAPVAATPVAVAPPPVIVPDAPAPAPVLIDPLAPPVPVVVQPLPVQVADPVPVVTPVPAPVLIDPLAPVVADPPPLAAIAATAAADTGIPAGSGTPAPPAMINSGVDPLGGDDAESNVRRWAAAHGYKLDPVDPQ